MSPKKKEGREAPHAPFLCHIWCLYCGQCAGASRSGCSLLLLQLHPCADYLALPSHFFQTTPQFYSLWDLDIWYTKRKTCWAVPEYDLEMTKRKKKGEKTPHVHCLGFSAAFAEYIAVYLNKGFCLPWRDERGTSPFTSESRDAHTALLWNTTSLVPCSRVCSSNGALRRPICLADHCLFDVAANVTFLFQSKTQQGVPSVWHSLPSLPRCLFVQIILHGNFHGSFIPWFW